LEGFEEDCEQNYDPRERWVVVTPFNSTVTHKMIQQWNRSDYEKKHKWSSIDAVIVEHEGTLSRNDLPWSTKLVAMIGKDAGEYLKVHSPAKAKLRHTRIVDCA